jgi:hypothetical protein
MGFDGREYMEPPILLTELVDLTHATVKSGWVDMANYDGCLFLVTIGTLTGSDGSNYMTPTLYEHSTTADTGATAVAAADIKGTTFGLVDGSGDDNCVQYCWYTGSARYVGVNLVTVSAGTYPTGYVGVYAIPYKNHTRPGTAGALVART